VKETKIDQGFDDMLDPDAEDDEINNSVMQSMYAN
jgi:hypothetical protein